MYIELQNISDGLVAWACRDHTNGGVVRSLNGLVDVKNVLDITCPEFSSETLALIALAKDQLRDHAGIQGRFNISFSTEEAQKYYASKSQGEICVLLFPLANICPIHSGDVNNLLTSRTLYFAYDTDKIVFRSRFHDGNILLTTATLRSVSDLLSKLNVYPRSIIHMLDRNFNTQFFSSEEVGGLTHCYLRSIGVKFSAISSGGNLLSKCNTVTEM